jgi:hypothetical protein
MIFSFCNPVLFSQKYEVQWKSNFYFHACVNMNLVHCKFINIENYLVV